jgi:hypothetical protein
MGHYVSIRICRSEVDKGSIKGLGVGAEQGVLHAVEGSRVVRGSFADVDGTGGGFIGRVAPSDC